MAARDRHSCALSASVQGVQLRVSDLPRDPGTVCWAGVTEASAARVAVIDRSERVPKNVLEEMLKDAGYGKRRAQRYSMSPDFAGPRP